MVFISNFVSLYVLIYIYMLTPECDIFFIHFFIQCSEETTLDRAAVKLKIGKDLKNIVQHTMQVEELWEQRESQLDTNKRSSSQFHEFEKEIRKVKLPQKNGKKEYFLWKIRSISPFEYF